jgi:hypothetical protein
MTTTIDITTDGAHDEHLPQPEATGGHATTAQPAGRATIATELLTAHPGNVRRDIHLDQEFLDSVAELGILTPLRITPAGGVYRVIEGHRRLAAAEQLGHAEVMTARQSARSRPTVHLPLPAALGPGSPPGPGRQRRCAAPRGHHAMPRLQHRHHRLATVTFPPAL